MNNTDMKNNTGVKARNMHYPKNISNFKKKAWQSDEKAKVYAESVDYNLFSNIVMDYFCEYIKPTDKVLDVGAGTGRLSLALARYGCDVTAVDISEAMIQHIESNKEDLNIKTIVCDCENISLDSYSFDVVTSLDLLCHFPEWKDFLKEKTRLAKNEGYIIFSAYSGDNFKRVSTEREPHDIADRLVGSTNYFSSIAREELQIFCDENDLKVINMIPYRFFHSALLCDNLDTDEIKQLTYLIQKASKNKEFMKVIETIEKNVTRKLSTDICTHMFVILQKK